MKKKDVKRAVKKHLPGLIELLRLAEWDVAVDVIGDEADEDYGRADIRAPYRTAVVTLNAHRLKTIAKVRRVLRHELLHLVLADVDRITFAAEATLSKRGKRMFREVSYQAEEAQVERLERILDRLDRGVRR